MIISAQSQSQACGNACWLAWNTLSFRSVTLNFDFVEKSRKHVSSKFLRNHEGIAYSKRQLSLGNSDGLDTLSTFEGIYCACFRDKTAQYVL